MAEGGVEVRDNDRVNTTIIMKYDKGRKEGIKDGMNEGRKE